MSNVLKFTPNSDDEEDLEALRLAALQTLKKVPQEDDLPPPHFVHHTSPEKPWSNKGFRHKRGKYFGQHQGWGGKNFQGHFGRTRNSNLISIPTISDKSEEAKKALTDKSESENNVDSTSSKFNRYNKSDRSESETEDEELLQSDDGSPGKLERSDSLEALMQELDDEIQGKTRAKEEKEDKPKIKKVRKKKKASESEANKDKLNESPKNESIKKGEEVSEILNDIEVKPEQLENETNNVVIAQLRETNKPAQGHFYGRKRPRSRSPHNRFHRRRARNFPGGPPNPPMFIPFGPPPQPIQFPPHVLPFPDQQFNPIFVPPAPNQMVPQFFDRPLSPLLINTESLTTATMAPLSPRSAAFVLENKAIVERRKRSPRRSYSRSLSRSPRRSLTPPRRSPRRSMSPRRSRSPRRLPPRKRSVSPRRRSLSPRRRSVSPKRRSISPKRRIVEKVIDKVPAPVRDRLGVKPKAEDVKEKEKLKKEEIEKKEDKLLDPVLEARRKKFETNEIKMTERIIRLKPKEEKLQEDKPKLEEKLKEEEKSKEDIKPKEEVKFKDEAKNKIAIVPKEEAKPKAKAKEIKPEKPKVEVAPATTTVEEKPIQSVKNISVPDEFTELEKLLNEDVLLGEDLEADAKVEDIFSDEDSASDTEGRFKAKKQNTTKPPIISFTKLINGVKTEIKSEPLSANTTRGRRNGGKARFDRSHTPPLVNKNVTTKIEDRKRIEPLEKSPVKQRITLKATERRPPSIDKRFERKIEIKIKNPSKYERSGKSKAVKSEVVPSKVERKVNIGEKDEDEEDEEDDDDSFDPEIIVENDSSDEEYANINEGDLRAQLSKKRAKKLHKIPVDEVSSRLLQYALQGAVFSKKKKKKSKEQELVSSEFAAIKKFVHADYISRKLCLSIKTERKVRVCKHAKFEFKYSCPRPDGKLPIHLRLGIANSSEGRPKRKSRKRKNREVLEQV